MEHWIYHEIQAYLNYHRIKGSLGFWGTPQNEIDFIWWYGENRVAIEVKSSIDFRPEFLSGIKSFSENKKLCSSWIVYLGSKELKIGDTTVMPAVSFLKKLYAGDVLGEV